MKTGKKKKYLIGTNIKNKNKDKVSIVLPSEQKHLEEKNIDSYLESIYDNMRFKIKGRKKICVELPKKTLKFKYNIQEMFDEYMEFKSNKKDEKSIREEIECYREDFEKKYDSERNYILENDFDYEFREMFVERKFDEFIDYRENIQKNMMERIDDYFNREGWYVFLESFIMENKSLKEIQEELQTTFFKEVIDDFILSEFNMWFESWKEI